MLLAAAFMLTLIATSMLYSRCSTLKCFIALMSTTIATVVLLICCLVMCGSYKQACSSIKEEQLRVISEYNHSSKSEQDWQWLIEHIEDCNDDVVTIHNDDDIYRMLDALYLIECNSVDLQCIGISDDGNALITPESYDIIAPCYND